MKALEHLHHNFYGDDSVKAEPDPNDSDSGMEEIRRIQELDRPNLYGRDKGFNPENLTFDGVKIKEGDEVELYSHHVHTVESLAGRLVIDLYDIIPLSNFNVIAHYPKSELEEAELELQKAKREIAGFTVTDEQFDRYYQARKKVEESKTDIQNVKKSK